MSGFMELVRRPVRSSIPLPRYDIVVAGAGMGGLTAAALLARGGERVLLLEAIHYPGGCASSYEKAGGVFDVGATTFSGTAPGQPLADLFAQIGRFDGLLPADPPMGISIDGQMITRHRNRGAWAIEVEQAFGRPMRSFWNEIAEYSDEAYALMSAVPYLPPQNIGETAANLRYLRPSLLRRLPHLFSTVAQRLARHGVDTARFRRFIDAQLLITSQAGADRVPFFAGALGLSYPDYPLYSVRGGMIRYARFLESRAADAGAHVAYNQRITAITQSGAGWRVGTATGAVVDAGAVITNLPVFNLPAITEGAVRAFFRRTVESVRSSGVRLWGAFTMYALVDGSVGIGLPINMQVVLPAPLVQTGSSTLFLTFSHPDDGERAPAGYRTLTISTHLAPDHPALRAEREEYREWKTAAEREIALALRKQVPEFCDMLFHHIQSGTPRTFGKYTGRADGMVGGIPLDRRVFPFRYPRPATPFDGLFCIGDTFFPGQGIPGVTLGALSLAKRMGVMK